MSDINLRDHIATQAMQALLSNNGWHPEFVLPDSFKYDAGATAADSVSRAAYAYADAMIKARQS